jgi:hypothetical protein
MDISTFLVSVYCIVDDNMPEYRLRKRGPQPRLSDSEVITMEIVGEFLGIDTDKGLYLFFKRHYGDWFPAILNIHRTTFTRQAANLWKVKEAIWQKLIEQMHFDRQISIVDSFPMPVCRFARAYRCRRLRTQAAFGYDEVARQTFLGLRAHLRVCWPGVIVDTRLAAANVHELTVAEELFETVQGWALGDRNYWSPALAEKFRSQGLTWLTPYKSAKREKIPFPKWLKHKRYRIETVIGQLVERFHAKKVWAKDAWHLLSRWFRKVLSHTMAVFLCQKLGLSTLQFADLLVD